MSVAPEDAVVIAEVLRRIRDAVGRLGVRADGNVNHGDLYNALNDDYERARREARGGVSPSGKERP